MRNNLIRVLAPAACCSLFFFFFPAVNIRDLVGQREENLCGIFLGYMDVDFILNIFRHIFHLQGEFTYDLFQ